MTRRKNKKLHQALTSVRAQGAIDRADYFSRPGATPTGWRGGPHTVQKDRRKEASRRACRGHLGE